MEIDPFTAELCGIILGDGSMHKTQNRITISGSSDDIHYFKLHVIPLFKRCFPVVHPRIIRLKTANALNLEIQNVTIFQFFLQTFGFKRGPKNNARIPEVILADPSLRPHFLRGLFDTDGCLKFSKQARDYSYYPRIKFGLAESPLIHELQGLLSNMKFIASKHSRLNHGYQTTRDLVSYEISGMKALERWFNEIKPANPVHIAKYVFWKRYGFHMPYLSLKDRLSYIGSGGFEPPSRGPEPPILSRYTTSLKTLKEA